MKRKITFLLSAAIMLLSLIVQPTMALGQTKSSTVTYTISAKNTLTTTGTAPTGSSATVAETYSTSCQMTSGNSQTLTLTGYNGYKVTNITLSMKSNGSSGAGKLKYSIDGGSSYTYIVGTSSNGVAFNQSAWNGAWSTSYVDISKNVEIEPTASNFIIKVEATANSLYCRSYTLTYEPVTSDPTITLSETELSGFSYVASTTSSNVQTFTISGSNLGAAVNLTLNNDNFELSKDGISYSSSLEYTNSGTLATSTVYVRLKSGLSAGDKTATLTASSTDADDQTISLSGRVISSTTYAITCDYNDDEGTLSAAPTLAYETQTVTLSYTAESGYTLASIVITKTSDGSATDITPTASGDDYTFTMPGYAVTATATFNEVITFKPYTSSLTEGDYIICDGTSDAMNTTVTGNRLQNTSVSPNGSGDIITSNASIIWHIAASGDYWTIYNADANKYAASTGKKSESQLLADGTDDKSLWTISGTTNYTLTNKYNNSNSINAVLRYNSGYGFACYANGTVKLYKRQIITSQMDVTSVDNGVITATPAGGSTIAEGGNTNVGSGIVVTLSSTPATNYVFNGWDVYKTSNSSKKISVTSNQFTMPGYPVTVSASFRPANDITITYSVNGNTSLVEAWEGKEGTSISLPSTSLSGFVFKGWTATAGSTALVSNPYTAPSSDITLYAVFALEDDNTIIITSSSTNFPSSYTEADYILEGKKFRTADVMKSTKKMQFKASSGTLYNVENFGRITNIVLTYDASDANKNVTLLAGTTANPTSGTEITPSISSSVYTYDLSDGNYTHFVITNGSGVGYLASLAITYEKNYSTITNITETQSISNIAANQLVTVQSPAVVTITGTNNGNAANLVIEDGAQLISTDPVAATIKKAIEAPNSKDAVYGWYTISSPVHDGTSNVIAISSVPSLTAVDYDMLSYDEVNHTWRNQKASVEPYSAGFSTMNVGQGYMYRNNDNEISFIGNTNVENITRTLTYTDESGELAGFHLVGNPYSQNITLMNTTLLGSEDAVFGTQLSGCYVLTKGNAWGTALETDATIKPGQGFLIQITSSDVKKIRFSKTPRVAKSRSNGDNIEFIVSNSEYEDNTFALFDDAMGLNKIEHRNTEVPMIYIPQKGTNYAIAPMSDDTQMFGLNFKAATMGQYTLSMKAAGEYNYIHVIDRLTGEDIDMLLEGKYSFIGSPRDNESRFIVKLGYVPDPTNNNNEIFAYQSGSDIVVTGSGELQIFDVTGRSVMTTTINGVETIGVPTTGMFILRLVGSDVKTQKIVVE